MCARKLLVDHLVVGMKYSILTYFNRQTTMIFWTMMVDWWLMSYHLLLIQDYEATHYLGIALNQPVQGSGCTCDIALCRCSGFVCWFVLNTAHFLMIPGMIRHNFIEYLQSFSAWRGMHCMRVTCTWSSNLATAGHLWTQWLDNTLASGKHTS